MGVESLSSWLRGQENLYQSVRVNISNANLHGGQSSTCLVFDLRALGLYLCRYLSAPPDQCGDYSEFAASAHGVSSNPFTLTRHICHTSVQHLHQRVMPQIFHALRSVGIEPVLVAEGW